MDGLLIIGSALVGGFTSGLLPLVNAELLVAGGVLAIPAHLRAPFVVACAVGQMASKTALFSCARWAPRALPRRASDALRSMGRRSRRHDGVERLLLFSSASVGLPPFYVTSITCGALGTPLLRFVALGLTGRVLRFGIVGLLAIGAGESWPALSLP